MKKIRLLKSSKKGKPIIGKPSITAEDIRNSQVLKRQIERGQRMLKECPFPIELLRSK
jgi:hypothetical protein